MLCAVVAHPDDAEIGCGGWLALKGGVIIDVTCGQNHTRDSQTAFEEQQRAAKFLGVKVYVLPLIEPVCTQDVVAAVDDILLSESISTVLTHAESCENSEHRVVNQIALAASRRLDNVLYMEPVPPDRGHIIPQFYVDISTVADKKYRAMNQYKSQLHKEPWIKVRRTLDAHRGAEIRTAYAEAYQVVRYKGE